ncbi:MAG: fructose-2,6-bisphosphatase [Candidatus Saccharibacteria bacterium]|nr:fructose-2,6-bisphosphatase [Candidatus Saccharibacteria bacterium]
MKLYAARHGQTTWNIEGRILGSTPGELTEKGINQAGELALHVRSLDPDITYASDLLRVAETAERVQQGSPDLEIVFTDQLRERNFGELEGRLFASMETKWGKIWDTTCSARSFYGAESLDAFTLRIARFVSGLHGDMTVLLLCHIGVMNRLNYLTDPDTFEFISYPNASIIEFDYERILHNSQKLRK